MKRWMILILTMVLSTAATAALLADGLPGPYSPPPAGGPKTEPSPNKGAYMQGPNEQQEGDLLKWLKTHRPTAYQMLANLHEGGDAARYHKALSQAWYWYNEWRQEPKEIQDIVQAEQEAGAKVYQAANALRNAPSSADQGKLKEQLRLAANQQFQMEQKRLEMKLSMLEKQIGELRSYIKNRGQRQDQIIADRIEQLMHHRTGGAGQSASEPVEP